MTGMAADFQCLTSITYSHKRAQFSKTTGVQDYGLQFKVDFLKVTPPTTTEGIERYLGSGMIKGIRPVYPQRLAQLYWYEAQLSYRLEIATFSN
jgi:hypothetical protein